MYIYETNNDVMILQLVEHNIVCISIVTVTISIMLLSSSQLYM